MTGPAWLFDVYPHPRQSALVVWVKHGRETTSRLVPYRPDFCVKAEAEPLSTAERILATDRRVEKVWRSRRRLWLKGPLHEVLRIRPWRLQDTFAVANDLRRATRSKGFLFFDVDHRPESRWMHANGLFSMCRLAVGPEGPLLMRARDEDRWGIDYQDPGLRTVRLAVEARMQGHEPSFDDPLKTIRIGDHDIVCRRPGDAHEERKSLMRLAGRLAEIDPDVITTRHGDRWDVPYLLRRIRKWGLERHVRLSRSFDPDPDRPDQRSQSLHTYGRWLFKTHAYYLRGRWHIDLAKKPLDSEDDRKDIHGILYMSRTSNRRPQDVNRNGAGYALQQMQVDAAVDQGVALPWKRNLAEDWKDAATLCAVDRGGQIVNPGPGIHEDVAACDFSAYYPSIVVTHNLSSDTINCECCPDGPVIPELGYHVCTRRRGHQSRILARLAPHRRYVKALLRRAASSEDVSEDWVAKASAIKSELKAVGVVCFGYFRYRNARFGCAEVHQAIQAYGRDGMTRARQVAQRMGFEMMHSMTDCAFVQKPGITRADARRLARRIADEVGVPMDVEGVYKWVVFLPSKTHSTTSDVGVPNRYYGLFEDGTLKVRGIEVQRHSTPDWIYDVQQGMLDVFARASDAAGFRAAIPEALAVAKAAAVRLRRRDVPAGSLGIMTQTRMPVEEYRANTNTKAALRRLRQQGTERRPGEYVKYVVTRQAGPWAGRVVPVELADDESPWLGGAPVRYDVDHYLRLLARSVETLLAPFGYTEDAVSSWLTGRSRAPGAGRQRAITQTLPLLRAP